MTQPGIEHKRTFNPLDQYIKGVNEKERYIKM